MSGKVEELVVNTEWKYWLKSAALSASVVTVAESRLSTVGIVSALVILRM